MPRPLRPDPSIGQRIEDRRRLLGLSIRGAADRAGISHTSWRRIELGEQSADNRFILAGIARALDCSTVDLAGGPVPVADRDAAAAQASVSGILQALVETDLDEPVTVKPRPLDVVAADAELVWDLRLRCDYAGAGRMLPRVLRELHAHAKGREAARALHLLTRTADAASFIVRYVGHQGEAFLASDRARDAARTLGEPVTVGLAAWSLGHAATGCGSYERALRLAEGAIPALEQATGAGALEILGSLHMLAMFSRIATGRDPGGHLDEASRIADLTGDSPTLGLNFGPTNIRCWRLSMEVDGGDPGKAVELAAATDPTVLTLSRQTSFFTDTGRALARLGRDREATAMLVRGERVAPQRVHQSSLVRSTVRYLMSRPSGAVIPQLRGLSERMGMAPAA